MLSEETTFAALLAAPNVLRVLIELTFAKIHDDEVAQTMDSLLFGAIRVAVDDLDPTGASWGRDVQDIANIGMRGGAQLPQQHISTEDEIGPCISRRT
jgi:hypothetical protein